MQWTKISVKYAEHLFSDASDGVFRTYIRVMLLVTSMEFPPNLTQIQVKLGKRKVQSLLDYIERKQEELGEDKISLDIIIDKVMEDVNKVLGKRESGKERQQRHRSNALHNADVTPTRLDKIRLDKIRDISTEIITHLNTLLKTNYRSTEKTKSLIKARQNEGATKEDFFKVHQKKYVEWKDDEKMCKFLRPETLYSNKFDGYLNQKSSEKHKKPQERPL